MTYILFVPGLNGDKSIATQTDTPVPGTNYFALKQVADAEGIPCFRAAFQSVTKPYPTLTEMGLEVASQIKTMQDTYGNPGLIVASSVGTGVTLQALSQLEHEYDLPHVIAFKPVFDPLNSIAGALAKMPNGMGAILLQKLKAKEIPALPIPVEATYSSAEPGKFFLTQAHIDDPDAIRFSEIDGVEKFARKLDGRKMASLTLIVANDDSVASENITEFSSAARPHAKGGCMVSVVTGTHADDHSARLAQEVQKRLGLILQ